MGPSACWHCPLDQQHDFEVEAQFWVAALLGFERGTRASQSNLLLSGASAHGARPERQQTSGLRGGLQTQLHGGLHEAELPVPPAEVCFAPFPIFFAPLPVESCVIARQQRLSCFHQALVHVQQHLLLRDRRSAHAAPV